MRPNEFKKASLHKVVETTLDEYVDDCQRDGYRKDKSGYIGQILDKVKVTEALKEES